MCSLDSTFEGPCFGYSDRHRWCLTPGHKNSCEMVSAVATSDEVVEKKEVVTQVEGRHQGIGHKSLLRSDALYQVHCIQMTYSQSNS